MVSELKLLGQESVMLNSPDIKNLFSDFRRNVQAFGTPWWISDLLSVADEVRDRTIFVKIKSQLHSWTDLEIKYLFSEFGMIEEVTYLPEVSGFHSRVRFQTIYDSEWAYYYYGDGRFAHHGCCEIEMHRADDAIRWNDERNTEIKVAYGSRDTHVMMDSECLTGELLMNEEMLNQVEESIGDPAKKKLNVVKETSGLIAHQMLEEMPKSIVTHEVKFLDEIGKKNDELVDGFGLKAPPIGSVERLDDVKALGEGKPRDAIPTIHALKLDFSEQARMMNGIVNAICFDSGGTDLTYGDLAISLPNGNYESDAGEEKELIQVEGSEPVAVKEISDYIAHHVLDNMPSRETELMTELSRDNDTLNQQKLVVRVPAVPESKWDKKLDAIELLKVVDISTNGGLVTSLPNGAEKTTNELVTAEHELQVDAAPDDLKVFRGGMIMIYMGLMCFDPRGLLVINAFSCLIANEKPHFGYSVGTLIFYPGSYVAEVLVFLQAFDYEMSAYLGWSAKIKSCSLDVLKETSNMLSCSLGNTKPDEEHKTLKVFEVKDLKYITPLLLVINESSDFVQFPSKLPAQKVRMVDYIVVVCFNVWVFDPGGHLLIHATFGVAENLLNASAENIIENLLNASAVHGHLDAVFDPRESELIPRDRTNCLFNESAFAFVIHSPCLGVDINEARHQRIQITNQHLVTVAAVMGVDTCSHLLNFGEYSMDFSSFRWSMLTVHHD